MGVIRKMTEQPIVIPRENPDNTEGIKQALDTQLVPVSDEIVLLVQIYDVLLTILTLLPSDKKGNPSGADRALIIEKLHNSGKFVSDFLDIIPTPGSKDE
jgi:hypothetical protein